MSDWDEDSEQLQENLGRVVADIRRQAIGRAKPSIDHARNWHRGIMSRLATPGPEYSGRFRGERGLEGHEVEVGDRLGAPANRVAAELKAFETRWVQIVESLDDLIPSGKDLSADEVAAVIDVCAWAHAEWIRIHPFANGNGRTARLLSVSIAMRYGLPAFVRARPRPAGGYGAASAAAMEGDWRPTARVFRQMYREAVRR